MVSHTALLLLSTYPTTVESQLKFLTLEDSEKGEAYYREFFHGKDHHNYLGFDDKARRSRYRPALSELILCCLQVGHAIVSIQGEGKREEKDRAHSRVLVRTKEVAWLLPTAARR